MLIHSYISFFNLRISVPANGSLRNSPSILEQICGVYLRASSASVRFVLIMVFTLDKARVYKRVQRRDAYLREHFGAQIVKDHKLALEHALDPRRGLFRSLGVAREFFHFKRLERGRPRCRSTPSGRFAQRRALCRQTGTFCPAPAAPGNSRFIDRPRAGGVLAAGVVNNAHRFPLPRRTAKGRSFQKRSSLFLRSVLSSLVSWRLYPSMRQEHIWLPINPVSLHFGHE